jgi:multidrug efflux pump subunit AcrA (membrane-fusion protein)
MNTAPESQPAALEAGGPPRGVVTIDSQRQQLIGVRLAPVTRGPLSAVVRTTGTIRYDERRMADVNLKLDGWIRDLYVDYTGQLIAKDQPLFTLYSPDLLTTQNEYLLALKTRDQMQSSQVADAREYAERLVEAARQRLVLWDLPPAEIKTLEDTRKPRDVITFRSPVSGYVLEKQAVKGMRVMPGQTLYKVADLSVVWMEADVYEQDMPLARVGQGATITLDAYPGESFSHLHLPVRRGKHPDRQGSLSVGEHARTVEARHVHERRDARRRRCGAHGAGGRRPRFRQAADCLRRAGRREFHTAHGEDRPAARRSHRDRQRHHGGRAGRRRRHVLPRF